MFNKLGLLAFVAPLVNALVLNIPSNPISGGTVTITWTFTPGDSVFSLELINEAFHDSFAIANNVQPELQTLTLTLPIVPVRDGYTLEAVNVGNIGQVFSTTGDFAVGPNPDSTAAAPSQTSASAAASSPIASASATGPATAPTTLATTGSAVRPVSSGASSGFGVTATSPSGAASATGSGSATAQSSVAPTINNGAPANFNFGGKGAMAAALLSALAGAAVVVL